MPDTANLRYNDWEVSARHVEIILTALPAGLRKPQLHRQIPGWVKGRITDKFAAGTYVMPLDSEIVMTFSDRHDVRRSSLLVAGVGTSSTAGRSTPPLMLLGEALRTGFADRRVMNMNGELYSSSSKMEYDIDDIVSRKYDLLVLKLSSTFREDR